MSNRWFRTHRIGSGTIDDPYLPDLGGIDVWGWCGRQDAASSRGRGSPPRYLVRVYAEEDVLDDLAREPQVVDMSNVPAQALKRITGQQRDEAAWSRAFRVS